MNARIAEAKRRNAARLERPSIGFELKSSGEKTVGEISVTPDVAETLLDAFGTTSGDFVTKELERLSRCCARPIRPIASQMT